MKLSIAQINIQSGDLFANTNSILTYIQNAAENGCDLVIFPEMSDTGYDMEVIVQKASDWKSGLVPKMCEAALKYNVNIVAGVSERKEGSVYNSVVVINRKGQITDRYRKTHLVTAEPMLEHHYLKPGDRLGLAEIDGHKIGIMTCYEVRFPEIARSLSLLGIELLIIPAAWPLVRLPHWQNLVVSRAIENQVFIAAANRLGNDTGIQFAGTSMFVGPYGNCLAAGSQIHEKLITVEVDFEEIQVVRQQIKVHQDRRKELYNY